MGHKIFEHKAVEEKWNSIHGRIRERWPQLTQDDVRAIDGDTRKLVAMVHQRSGDNISIIENAIDEIAADSEGLLSRIGSAASHQISETSERLTDFVSHTRDSVEQQVRQAPNRALAITFGAGCLIGLYLASRRPQIRRSIF